MLKYINEQLETLKLHNERLTKYVQKQNTESNSSTQ